jgi:hypothetical protein
MEQHSEADNRLRRVNINYADILELKTIPGFGEKSAFAIMRARYSIGNITSETLPTLLKVKVTDEMLQMMDFAPDPRLNQQNDGDEEDKDDFDDAGSIRTADFPRVPVNVRTGWNVTSEWQEGAEDSSTMQRRLDDFQRSLNVAREVADAVRQEQETSESRHFPSGDIAETRHFSAESTCLPMTPMPQLESLRVHRGELTDAQYQAVLLEELGKLNTPEKLVLQSRLHRSEQLSSHGVDHRSSLDQHLTGLISTASDRHPILTNVPSQPIAEEDVRRSRSDQKEQSRLPRDTKSRTPDRSEQSRLPRDTVSYQSLLPRDTAIPQSRLPRDTVNSTSDRRSEGEDQHRFLQHDRRDSGMSTRRDFDVGHRSKSPGTPKSLTWKDRLSISPQRSSDRSHTRFADCEDDYDGRNSRRDLSPRLSWPRDEPSFSRQHRRSSSPDDTKKSSRDLIRSLPKVLNYDGKENWEAFKQKFIRFAVLYDLSESDAQSALCCRFLRYHFRTG